MSDLKCFIVCWNHDKSTFWSSTGIMHNVNNTSIQDQHHAKTDLTWDTHRAYCASRYRVCALFSLQNHKCDADRWKKCRFLSVRKQLNRMWCNTVCFKALQRRLSLKKVLLTCSISSQNKWWGAEKKKYEQLTRNMHIQTGRLQISFHGGISAFSSSHLLIPNPIREEWRWVKLCIFVKCDQIEV